MPLAERLLTAAWTAAVVLLFVLSQGAHGQSAQLFFDNATWLTAFSLSAFLAWRGCLQAAPADRALRTGLFAGALLITLGQVVWIVQVALDWNPFPAPADLFFLTAGPLWAATVLRAAFTRLAPGRAYPAALDFGGAVLALLAFTLIIYLVYLPAGAIGEFAVAAVVVLYPVSFLTAAGVMALAVPLVGARLTRPHLLVLLGMLGYGLSWMNWNVELLDGSLRPGAPLTNGVYSLSALAFGWGTRWLRLEASSAPGYRRHCDQLMNYLPLVSMTLAAATLAWLFLGAHNDRRAEQWLVLACCLLVLVLAALRQASWLSLIERLRHIEAAVLRNEEQLYRVANFDALTGLPNRYFFEDALERAVAEAGRGALPSDRRIALLLVDLDDFRSFDEAYGRSAGDALLREAARRLSELLAGQGLLARLADDQFMVMVQRPASRTLLAQQAVALVEGLGRPWNLASLGEQFMGASIGISMFPEDAASSAELVQHAHSALRAAKGAGRATYRFYIEEFTQITSRRMELRRRLHSALRNGEFTLAYQPQLDHQRRTVGAEALLRWSVDGRAVPPDEFIPMAEESGLIVPIGLWVFEQTCRQIAQWRAQGLRLPRISVNVSGIQLREPGFAQALLDAARREGVAPDALILEITESQLLDESVYATAHALRNAGFALSIDDFGTGHSSLVKLKRLPVGELKIDQAFVRDIVQDTNDWEICATVNALARTLGLHVVAEGVETEEQFGLLAGMGCQRFQGWLFAKAIPPEQLAQHWLLRTAGPAEVEGS